VQYLQGPVLEENNYYPFGLTMAALSDKAIKTNYSENKFRYNSGSELQNKEFNDGTGLEMYEMAYRGFDPQLGRFTTIDPLASATPDMSPYQFAGDKPESSNDPTGAKATMIKKWIGQYASGVGSSINGPVLPDATFLPSNSGDGDDGDGENGGGGDGSGGDDGDYSSFWTSVYTGAVARMGSDGEVDVNFSNLNGNPSQIKIGYNYTANIDGQDVRS
jgi:RHS repeat-associated protein